MHMMGKILRCLLPYRSCYLDIAELEYSLLIFHMHRLVLHCDCSSMLSCLCCPLTCWALNMKSRNSHLLNTGCLQGININPDGHNLVFYRGRNGPPKYLSSFAQVVWTTKSFLSLSLPLQRNSVPFPSLSTLPSIPRKELFLVSEGLWVPSRTVQESYDIFFLGEGIG